MRKFKCQDCQYEFEVPFGQGGRGVDMTCPKCGSKNVFREFDDTTSNAPGWFGSGRAGMGGAWGRWFGGFGRGRAGHGRGWRRQQSSTTQQNSGEQQ